MARANARSGRSTARRSLVAPLLAITCLAFGWWCFDLIGTGSEIPDSNLVVRVLLSTERLGIRSRARVDCIDGVTIAVVGEGENATPLPRSNCVLQGRGNHMNVEGIGPATRIVVAPRGANPLEIGGRRYRGNLEFRCADSLLSVMNHVPLESYLVGCIGEEMPAGSSALAALEAQAIASRTYAVHRTLNGPRFLYDDTRSQVYRGVDAEHPRVLEAVRATAGLVIRGRRRDFAAFYSSTCGGVSSHGLDVFGDEGREHRSVRCDACTGSKYYRWSIDLDARQLAELAEALGIGNRLLSFEVSGKDRVGRVERLAIAGNRARRTATFAEVRNALRRVLGSSPRSSLWLAWQLERDRSLHIDGGGFGHGVGLCQVGAMELGRRGYSSQAIIQHYYPGTHLVSLP